MRKIFLSILSVCMFFTLIGCNEPEIVSLEISGSQGVKVGAETTLTTIATYDDGTTSNEEEVIWASSDTAIANLVNDQGLVKGNVAGKVVITATIKGKPGFCGIGGTDDVEDRHVMMVSDVPDGTVRIHFWSPRTTTYDGWGLWIWGGLLALNEDEDTWDEGPIRFEGTDSFGAYRDFSVADPNGQLNVIYRGVDGIQSGNITNLDTSINEFWFVDGLDVAFAIEPEETIVRTAVLEDKNTIAATIYGNTDILNEKLSIVDHQNNPVEITNIVVTGEGDVKDVVITTETLDLAKNYFTNLYDFEAPVSLSRSLFSLDELIYDGNDLGATLDGGEVTFKLWSPTATAIKVYIYDKNDQNNEIASYDMSRGSKGVWSKTISDLPDYDGYFYQYEVTAFKQTNRALDPYAKSMASFGGNYELTSADYIGKAAIVDMNSSRAGSVSQITNADIMASNMDLIAYEIHVRDFTIDANDVAPELRGKYLGFQEKVDHLVELGITHVQLMPLHNHYRVNEDKQGQDEMILSGYDENGEEVYVPNYNWGYDPHNFFTVEGHYSSNPQDPYTRIAEYRALIAALHEAGIGVIMDVVYNHTMQMDIFENVAPGCYHRPRGGSTPVSDPAVESRNPMVRKLIIDSLKHMMDNYGVDGFRFDLMGFTDIETLREIRIAVGDDTVLYGEAWNFTDLPREEAPVKGHYDTYPHGIDLAAFNDSSRDGYAGNMQGQGFVQGLYGEAARSKGAIIAGVRGFDNGGEYVEIAQDDYTMFALSPDETLQYLTCHDGFTLWDKINLSYDGTMEERARIVRQASAMLFTSQGKMFMHGGAEIARTKPLYSVDPETGRAHTTDLVNEDSDLPGVEFFHENTYRSSDYTNKIRWDRKENPLFGEIYEFYKGLIQMRRTIPAFRFASADSVKQGVRFLGEVHPDDAPTALGYSTFEQPSELTVKFINAPVHARNATYVFVGEIDNGSVTFNNAGVATRTLTKAEIENIGLGNWGNADAIDFKLLAAYNEWGTSLSSGNIMITPSVILAGNIVTVDFSKENPSPEVPSSGNVDFNLKFVNGPANATYYLVGEVHAGDANPASGNPYSVTFDANGVASIVFTPQQVAAFDLGKWGQNEQLNFKLTTTQGQYIEGDINYSNGNHDIGVVHLSQQIGVILDLTEPSAKYLNASYTAFTDIPSLTIKFINADSSVAGLTAYINGEVQPEGTDENPIANQISFTFDENSNGSITFTSEQMSTFRLGHWDGTAETLNFKLITTPGDWGTAIQGAYTGMGHNVIRVEDVLQNNTIYVDLSQMDYSTAPFVSSTDTRFIAYHLDNTLETAGSQTAYEELIVIHNADTSGFTLETDRIVNGSEWTVILDADEAGIIPVTDTEVGIANGAVYVPANSSAVIAR